jgi:hypothetical protein
MGRARAMPTGVKRKRSAASTASAAPPSQSSASPQAKARRASLFSTPSASQPDRQQASPAPQQTYIDVGQRSFGERSTCRACGLLYTVGEAVR